jgi:hypothetical protein
MLRSKIKPRNEPIVFLGRGLPVLANVLTESLLTDLRRNLFGEMTVGAIKKINAFCHGEGLSIDRMWLDCRSGKRASVEVDLCSEPRLARHGNNFRPN